jgi:hypothetical protein
MANSTAACGDQASWDGLNVCVSCVVMRVTECVWLHIVWCLAQTSTTTHQQKQTFGASCTCARSWHEKMCDSACGCWWWGVCTKISFRSELSELVCNVPGSCLKANCSIQLHNTYHWLAKVQAFRRVDLSSVVSSLICPSVPCNQTEVHYELVGQLYQTLVLIYSYSEYSTSRRLVRGY